MTAATRGGLCGIGAAGALALLLGAAPAPAPIGAGAEWPGINADSDETGFSRLTQITPANAAHLGLAWTTELSGEASLEASPVVVDGLVIFTGSYGKVYAVHGLSGKLAWSFDPKIWQHNPTKMNFGFGANRGVAYARGKIFSTALDGRLFALDVHSGKELWESETTDPKGGQTITGAPRYFTDSHGAGRLVVGQGGADFGQRGYVSAYDAATGKQVWKFYVVPASPAANAGHPELEAAAKSWDDGFWKKTGGGGGPWDSITWDAAMHRLYIGTANASPYETAGRSSNGGDNLYTASIVAIDTDSGKYLWHYQINPRDAWDYDCTQQITLATITIDGKPRRVLMQAPKNGFFYVIDRETGKPISAGKLGKVTWADHIDLATGRPVEMPGIHYDTGPAQIYPSTSGMHSWQRMAYSPRTGLVYVPTMQQATRYHRGPTIDADDIAVNGINVANEHPEPGDGKGALVAWDPATATARWKTPQDTYWNGGVAATAGGVLFQGTADGYLNAYDANNGHRLWRGYAGMGVMASPAVWSMGGREYVSVLAGYGGSAAMLGGPALAGWKFAGPRRLVTFALGAHAKLPASPPPTQKVNALDNPDEVLDPAKVAAGKGLFFVCAACHGRNTVGAGGPAPDLRESPIPLDSESFYQVVHGGALIRQGMPAFGLFGRGTVEALRQYVRSEARAAKGG